MNILMQWFGNSAALLLLSHLMESVTIEDISTALIAALVLGLINTLVRPVLIIVTLPINFITLGLFTLVINGLMFSLAATLVPGFHVDGFIAALIGAVLYSITCWAINSILSFIFGKN